MFSPEHTRIKICGLRRREDVLMVNEVMPDYAGFIFAPDRRRYVPPEKAKELRELLHPSIRAVGVFVDAPLRDIVSFSSMGIFEVIQLHGHEDEERIRRIRRETGLPVIKAVHMPGAGGRKKEESARAGDKGTAECFRDGEWKRKDGLCAEKRSREESLDGGGIREAAASCADFLLADSGIGGTGETFDWAMLEELTRGEPGRPVFLAGGLSPQNVEEAVRRFRPFGVDVSSGVETGGVKDQEKVRLFVQAVRRADGKELFRNNLYI